MSSTLIFYRALNRRPLAHTPPPVLRRSAIASPSSLSSQSRSIKIGWQQQQLSRRVRYLQGRLTGLRVHYRLQKRWLCRGGSPGVKRRHGGDGGRTQTECIGEQQSLSDLPWTLRYCRFLGAAASAGAAYSKRGVHFQVGQSCESPPTTVGLPARSTSTTTTTTGMSLQPDSDTSAAATSASDEFAQHCKQPVRAATSESAALDQSLALGDTLGAGATSIRGGFNVEVGEPYDSHNSTPSSHSDCTLIEIVKSRSTTASTTAGSEADTTDSEPPDDELDETEEEAVAEEETDAEEEPWRLCAIEGTLTIQNTPLCNFKTQPLSPPPIRQRHGPFIAPHDRHDARGQGSPPTLANDRDKPAINILHVFVAIFLTDLILQAFLAAATVSLVLFALLKISRPDADPAERLNSVRLLPGVLLHQLRPPEPRISTAEAALPLGDQGSKISTASKTTATTAPASSIRLSTSTTTPATLRTGATQQRTTASGTYWTFSGARLVDGDHDGRDEPTGPAAGPAADPIALISVLNSDDSRVEELEEEDAESVAEVLLVEGNVTAEVGGNAVEQYAVETEEYFIGSLTDATYYLVYEEDEEGMASYSEDWGEKF